MKNNLSLYYEFKYNSSLFLLRISLSPLLNTFRVPSPQSIKNYPLNYFKTKTIGI